MIGPALTPEVVLIAYRAGQFPMARSRGGPIHWYDPDPRGILPLDAFHCPRRLARTVRQGVFEIRVDTAFEEVMRGCARRRETWINEDIVSVYTELHRRGQAHSIEAWKDGKLAGGLYGVAIGAAFMAESKFGGVRDASKVCVVALVERLRERGFELLDVQYWNSHIAQFGVVEVPREEYRRRLARAVARTAAFR